MATTQQSVNSVSRPENVNPAAVAAAPGARTPSQSPDSNVTTGVASAKTAAIPQELEPDPESITNIVGGDFLVTIAVGIVTLLAVFGLIMALG